MKKILNYGITYKIVTENGLECKDEIYFTKKDMLTRYLNILDDNKIFPSTGIGSISELRIYATHKNSDTIEDLTSKINKFIM